MIYLTNLKKIKIERIKFTSHFSKQKKVLYFGRNQVKSKKIFNALKKTHQFLQINFYHFKLRINKSQIILKIKNYKVK